MNDPDLRRSIIGVPCYFHTMIAFACVVLLKVADRYRDELAIDTGSVYASIRQIIELLRSSNCGRNHLVHWMAGGLAKMLRASIGTPSQPAAALPQWNDDQVDSTLFNDLSDIPEQPSFPSVDPLLQMNTNYVSQDNDPILGSGPYLPMLETFEGNEYELTDLSFNFV